MVGQKTLTLGKKILDDTSVSKKIKDKFLTEGSKKQKTTKVNEDEFEKIVTEGKDGKGKTITYKRKNVEAPTSKQPQINKRAENLVKKQQKSKKTETIKKGVKVYDKPIGPMPKPKGVKVYDKPAGPMPKSQSVTKPVISSKQKQVNKAKQNRQNRQNKTVAKGKTVYNKPAGPFPKVYNKPIGPMPKPTSFLKRNKGKIAGGAALLSTVPFLINTDDSKIGAKENKKVTPSKDTGPDTSKITKPSSTVKVKKQTLPQTKANDYTGKYLDKEGNVAYESFSDFIAHMTGKPKKRAMPEKTARIIGTGNKLKRKEADTKGAGKGVKFQAFSGGGLIAGLYDKPEKAETYKGNTSSARQVKGYGKARKRP